MSDPKLYRVGHQRVSLDELLRAGKRELAAELVNAACISTGQTADAIDNLQADASATLQFPYPSLHRIVGRMAPGQLVFVMANTGQGKTTFLLDVLDRWAETHVRLDYLGTEQEPAELRTKWACLRSDIPADVAINRAWDDYDLGQAWKERLAEDLWKIDDAYGEQVKFYPDKFINLPKIETAAASAGQRASHVLIVDHIDRVDTGAQGENEYLAKKRLIQRLKEIARDRKLVLVVASQVNRKGREGDRLANYRPPQLHHMEGGAAKEHEADAVLGLWRPMRQRNPGEDPKAFKALMQAAARGDLQPRDFLEPNTMAVVCLKHRTRGQMEGERCKLRLHHGRLSELVERDQYTTGEGYYPRKVS